MSTSLNFTPESIAKRENKNSKGKKSLLKKLFKFGKDKKSLKMENAENEKSVETSERHLLPKNESNIDNPYLENTQMFSNGNFLPNHENSNGNNEAGIDPKEIRIDFSSPFKNKTYSATKKNISSQHEFSLATSCSNMKLSQKIGDPINKKILEANQGEIIKNANFNSSNTKNNSLFVYSISKEVCNGINMNNNNNNNMNESFEKNFTNKFSNDLDISGNSFDRKIVNGATLSDDEKVSDIHNTGSNQVPYVKIDLVTFKMLLSELDQCKRQLVELKFLLNET